MTLTAVDDHWLDFYALLGVPASADEDAIRKRIGKVYSEAAANSDHRDLARRHYFQALLERVLPQCRRVLLDPEWRAKYDRQHILNCNGDPSAQNYVAFITSMRSPTRVSDAGDEEILPQRVQDDINLAREIVECAWQGAQLELLPSQAVSTRQGTSAPVEDSPAPEVVTSSIPTPARRARDGQQAALPPQVFAAPPVPTQPVEMSAQRSVSPAPASTQSPVAAPPIATSPIEFVGPEVTKPAAIDSVGEMSAQQPILAPAAARQTVVTPFVEEIVQSGPALHAQVLTSEEAAAQRRERAIHAGREVSVGGHFAATRARSDGGAVQNKAPLSRVAVGEQNPARLRAISPTSLHLMVAIVGVLLTITVQHFSNTPAVASNAGRLPILIAVAPEMETALSRAEAAWERTPDGAGFDVVLQPTDSLTGLGRALGKGTAPDVWIPSDTSWVERYNRRAPGLKRQLIASDQPLAQSPMVLMARAERAQPLRRLFPGHQIGSWQALRGAIMQSAAGHLGLSDPQKTESGALARVSMAREWGASNGLSPVAAAKNPKFWSWMAGFEDNAPSASARTADMVKDMAQNTTGRFWWVLAYESDALQGLQAGKNLEIFYLPRTTYANHPFCALERVGASGEVAAGRAAFEKFLRSQAAQKLLLGDGFRPSEVNLKTRIASNPFLNTDFRARGARIDGLPLEERANTVATEIVTQQWGKRYG